MRRAARRSSAPSQATLQQRVKLTQLLTVRPSVDNLTAADLVRWTGLSEPECSTELERERLRRGART